MGCGSCSGVRPGYEQAYQYLRTGHPVEEFTDHADAVRRQQEMQGAGRIQRVTRKIK